jgi:hypothetical protein
MLIGDIANSKALHNLSVVRPISNRVPTITRRLVKARAEKTGTSVDVDQVVKDLTDRWDKVEDKTSVILYGSGAIVLLWLAFTIVGAVNNIPLFPKLMELVGLSYTAWFTYRYLLFKSSRQELVQDIDELKKKISGEQ